MRNDELLNNRLQIAQFRFALIAPVVQGLFPDETRTAYYKRVTAAPLAYPGGQSKTISYKTVEKWVSDYNNGGFDALMPKGRSDKGSSRALPDVAIEEIFRMKQEFPRMNATQAYHRLIEEGYISNKVGVSAVQRFFKRHDLRSARDPNMQDRKAFEESAFGRMWQTDSCYFPHITENGKSRRVYAVCIIDDHSRLIVGAQLSYSDSAANFQGVLKQAVATYGIPTKLYTDNGAPYANEQLSLICGEIGTVLLHTKVRDGASKAKIERFWRTCKETWLYCKVDPEKIHSLEEFNAMFREYIRAYNLSMHSGIGCRPFDRYEASKDSIRIPGSTEWLDLCFLNRISRKVKKDATVTIDGTLYDVPMQFIGETVEVRYRPDDMASAVVYDNGKEYPIRLTNKNENCRTKRNNPVSIDYAKINGEAEDASI